MKGSVRHDYRDESTLMRREHLISEEYRALQTALHMTPRGYGAKGAKWAASVIWLAKRYQAASVLDYGCGQGSLARELHQQRKWLEVREYDPAIKGKDGQPSFADLIVCTDVLEHIGPDRLHAVLTHIRQLARKAVFLVVALDPANKVLADGRNAHLIQKPAAWWEAQCEQEGFEQVDAPDLPMPGSINPEKRSKRWIAVLRPC
jgi:hypothetical protein